MQGTKAYTEEYISRLTAGYMKLLSIERKIRRKNKHNLKINHGSSINK
jgi:hypothetical protein